MIIETEGYLSLIEYLTENLTVFIAQHHGEIVGNETVEIVVMDLISSNIMSIFERNPDLPQEINFKLLSETDAVVADLEEVLAGCWHKQATNNQILFLEEYISLIKNLFDSVITHYK